MSLEFRLHSSLACIEHDFSRCSVEASSSFKFVFDEERIVCVTPNCKTRGLTDVEGLAVPHPWITGKASIQSELLAEIISHFNLCRVFSY